VFLGTHSPKLDDKGRLFLPARFREVLEPGVVITKGQENCLYVFKKEDFQVRAALLQQASLTQRSAREYGRMFFSSAHDDTPDKQGRVTIPLTLRTYAKLTKDCVVLGANDRLEIWDAAEWQAYEARADVTFSEQDQEVLPGVF
jgi:MraZ protein